MKNYAYRFALTLSFLFSFAVPVAHGQIYVDANNGPTGCDGVSDPSNLDGSTWDCAYTDLQTAIDNASSSSELWVAQGIYKPDSESDSFVITGTLDGVEIYGGFETGDAFTDRAPREHRTILSGDLNGDDTDPDGDGIVEDADPNQDRTPENLQGGENAHHVLVLDGGNAIGTNVSPNITTSTLIEGVVVTAGQADGTGGDQYSGGLYCDGQGSGNECSPTLRGVVFAGNAGSRFGGALYNKAPVGGTSSPIITRCVFVGNAAAQRGGAIYNTGFNGGFSSPKISNTVFVNNAAQSGGAIYSVVDNGGISSPKILNSTFTGNTADVDGGAIHNDAPSGTSSPKITNTIFWGNISDADGDGAGMGDEIYNFDVAAPILSNNIIEGGLSGISENLGSSTTDEGGNLDQAPQFVDLANPAGGDGIFGTTDDGLRPTAGSPALDRGTTDSLDTDDDGTREVATDLTGRDRIFVATVDIGAYERRHFEATNTDPATGGKTGFFQLGSTDATVLFRKNTQTGGGLSATKSDGAPSGSDLPDNLVSATWTVSSDMSGGATTYDITFDLTGVSGISNFEDLSIYKSNDGGTTWTDLQSATGVDLVYDPLRRRIAADSLDAFSQFAVGGGSNPLPIELASFEGRVTEAGIRLTWQTASETRNASFQVQRREFETSNKPGPQSLGELSRRSASTGEAWQTVGSVPGTGTTDQPQTYRFTDADVPYAAEVVSYRLKQVDTDGSTHYSEPMTVTRAAVESLQLLGTYPNPVRQRATVQYGVPESIEGKVTVQLYDMMGRRIRSVEARPAAGRHERILDVSGLSSGVYVLQLRGGGKAQTRKLTVVQ